jgi:hypothetical protein
VKAFIPQFALKSLESSEKTEEESNDHSPNVEIPNWASAHRGRGITDRPSSVVKDSGESNGNLIASTLATSNSISPYDHAPIADWLFATSAGDASGFLLVFEAERKTLFTCVHGLGPRYITLSATRAKFVC